MHRMRIIFVSQAFSLLTLQRVVYFFLHRVSRRDLYNEGEEIEEHNIYSNSGATNNEGPDVLIPPTEFEFVEVKRTDSPLGFTANSQDADEEREENKDEFEFPLFSFGVVEESKGTIEENQGAPDAEKNADERNQVKLMRISLKEPEEEIIDQKRPKEYYFTNYSVEQRQQFLQSSIDYDTVLQESATILKDDQHIHDKWPYCQGKIINLHEYNLKIELQQQSDLKIKKRRPGQKQRAARKLALERSKERDAKAREIKKMLKKKFHKRGGKKNKKKTVLNPLANAASAPKFRTE